MSKKIDYDLIVDKNLKKYKKTYIALDRYDKRKETRPSRCYSNLKEAFERLLNEPNH